MKKKNVLMMALSLCLVAVIAVGGTLAYLSDSDGDLVNTFKFANNIQVDVYEYTPGSESKNQSGYSYENLVVGDELEKDVDVDLSTNTKSVGDGTPVTLGTVDSAWTKVVDNGNGYGIYRLTNNVSKTTTDINVFDTVTVPEVESVVDGQYQSVTLNNVEIDVFAMQASGYDAEAALAEAQEAFA